jgi:phosphate-selective porin OprO and OprP
VLRFYCLIRLLPCAQWSAIFTFGLYLLPLPGMVRIPSIRNFFLIISILLSLQLIAQENESDQRAMIRRVRGIKYIASDSSYSILFRFRLQNQASAQTFSGQNLNIGSTEARIRRLRLRFEGFLIDPRLTYYLQLSFSRGDLDIVDDGPPNITRDAIVFYDVRKWWRIGFGQAKLPGNRQRVISSGNLQFAERSLANNKFTLDRDFGIFQTFRIGEKNPFFIKAVISSGEGRNSFRGDNGLCYTGRLEWIALGKFVNEGDYSEGDADFHATPSLSVGLTGSYNHNAQRAGGQLGRFLYKQTDIRSSIADLMFKYRGWGLLGEWFYRSASTGIQQEIQDDIRYVYTGSGYHFQASKMISRRNEMAFRYVSVVPSGKLRDYEKRTDMLMLGFNRYLSGHRVKFQSSIFYQYLNGITRLSHAGNSWGAYFQVEVGI